MSSVSKAAETAVKLRVRKSSIVAPLLLLVLSVFLFVVYALPSEHAKVAGHLGLKVENPTAADIIKGSGQFFTVKDSTLRTELWRKLGFAGVLNEVFRPLLKAYLEQLVMDFRLIVVSLFGTVWHLALFSLLPGLAGLIYRRNFMVWFVASFVLLMGINASGLFPRLGSNSEPMPGSGRLLLFLLSQLLVLILAYRLRRQSTSVSWLSPTLHNWLLKAALVAAGLTLWQFWTPWGGDEPNKPAAAAPPAPVAAPKVAGADVEAFRDCVILNCPALVKMAGGTFTMGSPPPPPEEASSSRGSQLLRESPAHAVTVKPFWIGRYEVTIEEWGACVAASVCPGPKQPDYATGRHPVTGITYDQAKQYAAWLSRRFSQTYRLPSESEWEFAARAGTETTFAHGDGEDRSYGWTDRDFPISRDTKLQPVGLKKPNVFGLYDMQGNVEEWVEDCWFETYAGHPADGSARTDCASALPSGARIARGGASYYMQYSDTRPRHRIWAVSERAQFRGLRLVREVGGTGEPTVKAALLPPIVAAAALAETADQQRDDNDSGGAVAFLTSGFTGWVFKWELILVGLPLLYSLLRNSAAWTTRQPKNIVICLDGTSNTPDQVDQGFAATTNVYKLFRMLKTDGRGMYEPGEEFDATLVRRYADKQIAFYYAGVGNKYDFDAFAQVFGMASGLGAAEIVNRAYLDLVRVYQKGDRVFIFGFSRGAAISRLLARTIDARGAPASVWSIKLFGKHRTLWASKRKLPVAVDVLGCWDTVGSFGVAKTIAGINFQQLNAFKDLSVPENVQQAYHMVALDEQRDSFDPTLMDPDPNRPERIVEVWFAGDHANIGGGWATDRLSDITLDFLLRRISSGYAETERAAGEDESWGLYVKAWKADKAEYWERQSDNPHIVDPDPLGQIQQWFSHLYEYRPRKMPQHAVISDTVFTRMVDALPLYAPQALFNLNDELDKRRDMIDDQVSKLTESALLSADDLQKIEGYKRKLRLNRFESYWNETLLPLRAGKFLPPEKALVNSRSAGKADAG